MERDCTEMAGARKVKSLLNKTWFKPKRGGQRITLGKYVPRTILEKEDSARRDRRRDRKRSWVILTQWTVSGDKISHPQRSLR